MGRLGILSDFWSFMKIRKKWWMLPVIIMLVIAGVFVVAGGSALSPFIYALF